MVQHPRWASEKVYIAESPYQKTKRFKQTLICLSQQSVTATVIIIHTVFGNGFVTATGPNIFHPFWPSDCKTGTRHRCSLLTPSLHSKQLWGAGCSSLSKLLLTQVFNPFSTSSSGTQQLLFF